MFGSIGGLEILFIFVLALLLFGPRKLPEIGRTIGRTLGEFKRATNDFTSSLDREIRLEKIKSDLSLPATVAEAMYGTEDSSARPAGPVPTPPQTPKDPAAPPPTTEISRVAPVVDASRNQES